MRRFELANLDVRGLDFERRLVYIREGKGGKARTIPASGNLLGDLKHLLGNREKGPVFTNSRSDKHTLRQINNVVARAEEQQALRTQTLNTRTSPVICSGIALPGSGRNKVDP